MLVGVTGKHGVGKSRFGSIYPNEFGFEVVNKKELLKKICSEEYGTDDWKNWYAKAFNEDPETAVKIILDHLPKDKNIYLDAIHSNYEWEIILKNYPDSHLIGLFAVDTIRKDRWAVREDDDTLFFEGLDRKRENFWHNPKGSVKCLMSYVDWAFNSDDDPRTICESFAAFLETIEKEKVNESNKIRVKTLKDE